MGPAYLNYFIASFHQIQNLLEVQGDNNLSFSQLPGECFKIVKLTICLSKNLFSISFNDELSSIYRLSIWLSYLLFLLVSLSKQGMIILYFPRKQIPKSSCA